MKQRKDYATEASKLGKAIDIAIESIKKHPPNDFTEGDIDHFVNGYSEWKTSLSNSAPEYRNLTCLKYLVEAVFTFFQESTSCIVPG